MGSCQRLEGKRFGKLIAIEIDMQKKIEKPRFNFWICRCDCGNMTSVNTRDLNSGHTKSCGCLKNRCTHGLTGQLPYRIWRHILARSFNPKAQHYDRYGGRGIKVCDRWLRFENFIEDMGMPFNGATIERIDNDKGYSPENCRWATRKEQAHNTTRNVWLEYQGERKILTDWSRDLGINKFTIMHRLKRGWSVNAALSVPVKPSPEM